nr:MAG TPA: hypothetical protein [Bacteriophage sp.]
MPSRSKDLGGFFIMYSILFNWIYYKKDDKTFKFPCKEVTYS